MICKKFDYTLKYIPLLNDGTLDIDYISKLITNKTKLISITHMSNVLGTINPIDKVIDLAKKNKIEILIDAAQSVSHIKIDVKKLDCDYLVFSGHKIMGPTGVGVLYGKKNKLNSLSPFLGGGHMIKQVSMEKFSYNDTPWKFEAGTPNIAQVLSESQDRQPASMFRPTQIPTTGALHAATPIVGEGLSKSGKEVNVIKGVEEEVVGSGATSDKVQDFLKKMGGTDEGSKLDVALIAAMQDRDKKERFYLGANSGDPDLGNSPLLDHPDIIGGEDDIALPGGTNTSSTQDLSSFHKEMRKMNAMERNKEAIDEIVGKTPSPSEKQVGRSPNELAGKDQSTFEALMNRNAQLSSDSEAARSRVEQKTAAQQRKLGIKSPLTEKYYPSNVARTDIQLGGMLDRKTGLPKSVGISYTPMNGDTKVGFNIMNDPTSPKEVDTFEFVAPPETMESMESRGEDDLGTKSFGKLFNIARARKQGFSGLEM